MTEYYVVMKTISRWNDAGDEERVTEPVAVLKVDGAWNPTVALKLVAERLGLDRRQLCDYGVPNFDAPCFRPVRRGGPDAGDLNWPEEVKVDEIEEHDPWTSEPGLVDSDD
jgi:hypothetical protein